MCEDAKEMRVLHWRGERGKPLDVQRRHLVHSGSELRHVGAVPTLAGGGRTWVTGKG